MPPRSSSASRTLDTAQPVAPRPDETLETAPIRRRSVRRSLGYERWRQRADPRLGAVVGRLERRPGRLERHSPLGGSGIHGVRGSAAGQLDAPQDELEVFAPHLVESQPSARSLSSILRKRTAGRLSGATGSSLMWCGAYSGPQTATPPDPHPINSRAAHSLTRAHRGRLSPLTPPDDRHHPVRPPEWFRGTSGRRCPGGPAPQPWQPRRRSRTSRSVRPPAPGDGVSAGDTD